MSRAAGGSRALAAGALGLSLLLGACGTDGPVDAISSMNPFKQDEQVLPGNRRDVLTGDDPALAASGQPARIGPAKAAGDWAQPGGTAANDPGNLAVDIRGLRVWTVRAGEADGGGTFGFGSGAGLRVSARPVAAGGIAYVYDPAGNVSAHSVETGGRIWRVNVRPDGERESVNGGGVATGDGRVYAGTGFGEVVALDAASGAVVWRRALDAPARSAPTVSGGRVYTVTQAGNVVALDGATGAVAWTASGGGGSNTGLVSASSPAVAGDLVVAPTSSGQILALDANTGSARWTGTVTGGSRLSGITRLQDASASPVISEGTVFATGVGGSLVAMSAKTGETQWSRQNGSGFTPVVSGNAVFLVDLDNRLIAFDRSSGTPFWVTALPGGEGSRRVTWAGPLLVGGRLILVSSAGQFIAVDAASGTAGTPGPVGVEGGISPVVAGGRVLVLGREGQLTAIE